MSDTELSETAVEEPRGTDEGASRPMRLFPDLCISSISAAVLLLCLYSLLCIFLPGTLDVRANPLAPPSTSKPAWYVLFLYRYLRLVPPAVGAMTPVLLLALLGAWPFLDRNPSREPRKRIVALALAAFTVIAIAALSYLGWTTQP